ncbi:MAG: Ig-like domain-containing protein, partial [Actinomycetota bacterium]
NWFLEVGGVDAAQAYFVGEYLQLVEGRLAVIDLSSGTGWKTLMTGAVFDPTHDQQAQKATTDLVGDATHGVLYQQYDDRGTATEADDEIAYRIRIGGSDSGGSFSSVMILGIDADLNGDIDIFITVQDNAVDGIKLFYPGTGANTSPNTTSTEASTNFLGFITQSNFIAVSASNDPDFNGNVDIGAFNGPDFFLTWKMPFSMITSQVAETNIAGNPAGGIAITKDSSLRYVIGSSTQTNAFNSDLGGVGADVADGAAIRSNLTFEQLGAFSPVVTASNIPPTITSDGAGATGAVNVATGTTAVTDVNATDQDGNLVTFAITGGADAAFFTIDPFTGALSFKTAPDVSVAQDAGANNIYDVEVTASDGKGGTDVQALAVTVTGTGDTAAPFLLYSQSSPVDGTTTVARKQDIVLKFSEEIRFTGISANTLSLLVKSGGSFSDVGGLSNLTSASAKLIISGDQLIIDTFDGTNSNLQQNKEYLVRIAAGMIEDLAGNDFGGILNVTTQDGLSAEGAGSTAAFDFDTSPSTNAPPTFTSSTADGQTIAASANIVLVFSETIALDT